eukprot:SAG31_NODE_23950_length_492_cov_1.101781_2_plen_90_part_01
MFGKARFRSYTPLSANLFVVVQVATPVRVSLISPGFVETEFSNVRFKGDDKAADAVYADFVPLYAPDIADNIIYCATRPAHVQIADIVTW